jgi:hypothetical protein
MSGREPTKDPKYLFQIDGGGPLIFSRQGHPPSAAALDFCNMLPPIDRSTVTLRAGTLLAST